MSEKTKSLVTEGAAVATPSSEESIKKKVQGGRDQRVAKAKKTWEAVALSSDINRDEIIDLRPGSPSVKVYDERAFDNFRSSVHGTYFMNGFGSCNVGDRIMHPYEAPGYLKSLTFDGKGTLRFKASIVETPLTKMERQRKKPMARGVMSSLAPYKFPHNLINALSDGDRDTANLMARLWPPSTAPSDNVNKRRSSRGVDPLLIVATDNGIPYAVDPATLKVKGELFKEEGLDESTTLSGKKMLAHNRYDTERNRLVFCASKFDVPGDNFSGNTIMEFFEYDDSFKLISHTKFKTDFIVFHDWMITDDYYVIPKNPAVLKWGGLARYICGLGPGYDIFKMNDNDVGGFLLIPRDPNSSKDDIIDVTTDTFSIIFHLGPCYQEEEDNDKIVVYGGVFDSYKFGCEMGFNSETQEFDPITWSSCPTSPPPLLEKFEICLSSGQIVQRERIPIIIKGSDVTASIVHDFPFDFAQFSSDGKRVRYCYFIGGSKPEGWFPFQSVVKIDLTTGEASVWDAGVGKIVSEPMLIPTDDSAGEDDGYVMSILHDADGSKSDLVVWDASRFSEGPIAIITLGPLMPWCVHGSWVQSYIPKETV